MSETTETTNTNTETNNSMWRVVDAPFTEEKIISAVDADAAIEVFLEGCWGHEGVPFMFDVAAAGVNIHELDEFCEYTVTTVYSVVTVYSVEYSVVTCAAAAAAAWAAEWLEALGIDADSEVWGAVMPSTTEGLLSLWMEWAHGEDRSLAEWYAWLGGDSAKVVGSDVGPWACSITIVDGAVLCDSCRGDDDIFWQAVGTERVQTGANYESVVVCDGCYEHIFGSYVDPETWLGHDGGGENVVATCDDHGLTLVYAGGEPRIDGDGIEEPLTIEEAREQGLVE